MSQPQPFEHEVSVELASLIPEEVRGDPGRLKDWVDRALLIGLKAMIEGSNSVDLSFVSKAFEGWKDDVSDKLIGPKSDFEVALKAWFEDSGGSFQRAFDLEDKKSPLGKFLKKQKSDRKDHHDDVQQLIRDLQVHLGYESGVADEAEKGTRKGSKFEEEVAEFLESVKGNSDGIGIVGEMLIDGTKRKVGDVLVEIDSPRSTDLKMILEVKAGADYTLRGGTEKKPTLPDQMTTAMQLRTCHGSIAVTDLKHLKKTQKAWNELDRHRILVAVDRDNEDFTLLEIAYRVLRYRLLQDGEGAAVADTLDIDKFNKLLDEILSRLETTTKMKRACTDASNAMTGVHADIVKLETDINAKIVEIQGLIVTASPDKENSD